MPRGQYGSAARAVVLSPDDPAVVVGADYGDHHGGGGDGGSNKLAIGAAVALTGVIAIGLVGTRFTGGRSGRRSGPFRSLT